MPGLLACYYCLINIPFLPEINRVSSHLFRVRCFRCFVMGILGDPGADSRGARQKKRDEIGAS